MRKLSSELRTEVNYTDHTLSEITRSLHVKYNVAVARGLNVRELDARCSWLITEVILVCYVCVYRIEPIIYMPCKRHRTFTISSSSVASFSRHSGFITSSLAGVSAAPYTQGSLPALWRGLSRALHNPCNRSLSAAKYGSTPPGL